MNAYYGGRAECRIRMIPVPVMYCDFLSMYPTVNALMGLWQFLVAEEVTVEEDSVGSVQEFLERITLEKCFSPQTWKDFTFYARVIPDGHVLPVRARYGDGDAFNIALNPLTSRTPIWYAGPDLIQSTLLTGKAPKVVEAFRISPKEIKSDLRPISLRGAIQIDPAKEDFFRKVIELRKSPEGQKLGSWMDKFLKVLANAGSYGIYLEMNRQDLPKKKHELLNVYGLNGSFIGKTHNPEQTGEFFFPEIASLITSAARLMLALLEISVRDAGGQYAFCDTDSMAIVASRNGGDISMPGGPLKVLSWTQAGQIVKRFMSLNPYDQKIIKGSILKIEDVNYEQRQQQRELLAYVIAAKRYALFTIDPNGDFVIRESQDRKESGLGHLLNPSNPEDESTNWIDEVWRFHLRDAYGRPQILPQWTKLPALSRVTVSSPDRLRPLLQTGQVQAFNFLLSAQVASLFGHPEGVDPTKFHLVAPYESDSRQWLRLPWIDIHSGKRYAVTTRRNAAASIVRLKTYLDVIQEHAAHPEPKSLGVDGQPCSRTTRGLLMRRPVAMRSLSYVGKESNLLEDVTQDFLHDWEEVLDVHKDPRADEFHIFVIPVLADIPAKTLAEQTGLTIRQIKRLRNAKQNPSPKTRAKLTRIAGDFARLKLSSNAPEDDIAACAEYLQRIKLKYPT